MPESNLKTERLILRPWLESDAESLYEYAKDPSVGPAAGWPVHTSVENSKDIIRDVLAIPETYAVCLKTENKAIGCVGLKIGKDSNMKIPDTEGEIGYWLGVPFWGQGLIPEACEEIIRHAFEDIKLTVLWCGYFEGNNKSKRVQEKWHFTYHHTNKDIYWKLIDDMRTEHVTRLTKQQYIYYLEEKTMKKEIAYCGLNCEKCDAFIATVNNDDALRKRTARLWSEMNHAPITAEMINCIGCRADGVKTPYCESMCEIRKCAVKKDVNTCGDCSEFEKCKTVGAVLENSVEARENLKPIN